MSFNDLPPELLIKIFADLLHIGSKIRLERVSKQFRDCIRNTESWKWNTRLEMSQFGSEEELRSFLEHAKEINSLSLRDYNIAKVSTSSALMAGTLFQFEAKLKVESFKVSTSLYRCRADNTLVACCLGKLHKSLKNIEFSCCSRIACDLLKIFAALLPQCSTLKHLTLQRLGDSEIIHSLTNLNLETLHLLDLASDIDGEDLAAVFNSATEHSIRSLRLETTRGALVDFSFYQFSEHLEPLAARGIKSIQLLNVYGTDFKKVLGALPLKMPKLSQMTLSECLLYKKKDAEAIALGVAEAIIDFLLSCVNRSKRIHVRLILCGCAQFSQSLWNLLAPLLKQSGTKRLQGDDGWKKSLTNHCGTIDLDIRHYDQ